MKKLLAVLLLLTTPALAGIQQQDVQSEVISLLTESRGVVAQCDSRLSAIATKVNAIKANYAGDLTASDKSSLVTVFSNIATARSSCSSATASIDSEYPSLNR